MVKSLFFSFVKLAFLSTIFWGIHYYLVSHFFTLDLYIPLWAIYCFNVVLVVIIYTSLRLCHRFWPKYVLQGFIGLTVFKMLLAILFLWPLFLNQSGHTKLEVFNFFIPYFIYLAIEIRALNRVLQNS